MLYTDAKDDFEIPLAGVKDHTLLYDTDSDFPVLLRVYREIYMEERSKPHTPDGGCSMDLESLLDSSLILQLDRQPGCCSCHEDSAALIVSATHVCAQYISLSMDKMNILLPIFELR